MKKLNKVAAALAVATMAGSAFADGATIDNWLNGTRELVWKNGTQELCWRDNFWTPATAYAGCDGAIVAQKTEPAPEPTPAPPAPVVDAQKVTYSADAFFDFDKAVLKPAGREALDDLAAKIQTLNLETLVAVGHTDSVGKASYNQRLSVRRAAAVKKYLVSKGIPAESIFTEGKGETQPVATNKTAAGRAQNRRVEVEVVGTPR
ncbi:MAG: OmpA family protein [Ottowia sp.]|nr:OmpA family protein [Ottowia sp.]